MIENDRLRLTPNCSIPLEEIELHPIRSQGAGGQNVNKVASAIHLRFDIHRSSLPEFARQRLLELRDRRISAEGVIVIKAQQYRTQEKNRQDALTRLRDLVVPVFKRRTTRIATRPSKAAKRRRLEQKNRRGRVKSLRRRVSGDGD